MFGSSEYNLTEDELYSKERSKTICDEKCLICSEESKRKDKCLLCNLDKDYYPIVNKDGSEEYYECLKKDEKIERYYFSGRDKGFLPCYKTCLYCNELGDNNNHKCTSCDYNYIKNYISTNTSSTFNCITDCNYNYYYAESGQYKCTKTPICPSEKNIYIEQRRKCVSSCKGEDPYIYLFNGDCVEKCPSGYIPDVNNNICKLILTEQCSIYNKTKEFITLYSLNMFDSFVREYMEEFSYTDKHFIKIINPNYNIIIFKDLNCVQELNIYNIPDLRNTTNGDLEEFDESNSSKEDSCYIKVQKALDTNEKLIVVYIEDKSDSVIRKGYLLYNPFNGIKTNFESICGEEVLIEKEDITAEGNNREKELRYIYLKPNINSSLFRVNHFENKKKLYYVNALNDNKGNLYFEFWGKNDNIRYFIGKDYVTGEHLLFDDNETLYINSIVSSNFHESIIINYENNTSIFSLDYNNINFINLKTKEISSKETSSIINNYNIGSNFSYRNSIIKLKNNKYLLSILIGDYINLISFNFSSDDINGFNLINNYEKEVSYSNSTECFQTENSFIQCFFSTKYLINQFSINIYSPNFTELNSNLKFGYYANSTFTKIFHLKDNIGVYIFFDYEDENKPKIFFEKNINKDIYDLFDFNINKNDGHQYITLDANGKFQNMDTCLFCSDAIKINDSKFIVFFTAKYSNELIICLFDLYNNDSSLRLRYYKLDLDLMNAKISVNLRAFVFKCYFGLVFYDLYNEYPGYLFFNYPNLTSYNKINSTTIGIKIFAYDYKPYIFSFQDNLEIINNIYGGKEKIKIINYSGLNKTGITIKSSKLNSEIYSNQILDVDDKLILEQSSEGIILGNHILEFIPLTIISNYDNNVYETFYYGNAKVKDFDDFEYFSNETFKIIYTIECYEQCSEDENGNIMKQDEILKNIKNEIKNDLNITKLENGEDIIIQNDQITYTITSTEQQDNLKKISNNKPIIDFNECKKVLIDNNIIEKDQNLYIEIRY